MKPKLIPFLLLLSACGSAPSAQNDRFTGTWVGTQTGTQNGVAFTQSMTLVLNNEAGSVTGTWIAGGSGNIGTLTGTATGVHIWTLVMKLPTGSCPGSASGDLSLFTTTTATLTGSIEGKFGTCGENISSLNLTQQ